MYFLGSSFSSQDSLRIIFQKVIWKLLQKYFLGINVGIPQEISQKTDVREFNCWIYVLGQGIRFISSWFSSIKTVNIRPYVSVTAVTIYWFSLENDINLQRNVGTNLNHFRFIESITDKPNSLTWNMSTDFLEYKQRFI